MTKKVTTRRHCKLAKKWPATIPAKSRALLLRSQAQFLRKDAAEVDAINSSINWLCDGKMLFGDVNRPGYYVTQRIVVAALDRAAAELTQRADFIAELVGGDGGLSPHSPASRGETV